MENKLTDNEVIQEATEATEKNLNAGCYIRGLLRIVKEQQAKIERLHEVINGFEEQSHKELQDFLALSEKYTNAKSEAIKEFAKRLKKQIGYEVSPMVCVYLKNMIDNLVKEMTGDSFTKTEHNSLCETETYEGRCAAYKRKVSDT